MDVVEKVAELHGPPKKSKRIGDSLVRFIRFVPILIGVVATALLLVALSGKFHSKVASPQVETSDGGRPIPEGTQILTLAYVTRPRFESAVGAIQPIHEADVAAKVLARVVEVKVTAGSNVKQGDLLAKLSDEEFVARLRQAEAERDTMAARLQQAKADFQRATQLLPNRAISLTEYDAAQTLFKTTEAQHQRASRAVDEAAVFLDYCTITAPFSGVVVEKHVEPGDTVTPGRTLISLYDPTQMQLVANVRESLAMKLKVGQQVTARLESLDHECLATVREVVPRADVSSRSFEVKVSGPCPQGIYSGMFGRIFLPMEDERLLLIPQNAIRRVGQLTLVDVVVKDKLSRRHVLLGREFGNNVEVLSGLRAGDQLAVGASATGGK